MAELSDEMQTELLQEMQRDIARFAELCQTLQQDRHYKHDGTLSQYQRLEQLTYITEQIRLKLKMLGAPRINW